MLKKPHTFSKLNALTHSITYALPNYNEEVFELTQVSLFDVCGPNCLHQANVIENKS
jgi:hypothetical protein